MYIYVYIYIYIYIYIYTSSKLFLSYFTTLACKSLSFSHVLLSEKGDQTLFTVGDYRQERGN